MQWLIYMTIGLFIWSICAVGDKYILKHVKSKLLYVFTVGAVYFLTISGILLFKSFVVPPPSIMILAFLVGLSEALALYYFFTAVDLDEVSKVLPLGAITSFIVLFGSWFILKDPLQGTKFSAFVFFLLGGALLAINHTGKKIHVSKALKPILMAGLLNSIWQLGMKHVFNHAEFLSGVYFAVMGILVGSFALLHADANVGKVWKSMNLKLRSIMIGNQMLAVVGYLLIMTALSLENAALVSSSFGMQYAFTFIIATTLTFWKPDLVGEDLHKGNMFKKLIGIGFIVLAVYLVNS